MQTKERIDKPLFTKDELKAYIEKQGYIIRPTDLDNMYDWYEMAEFKYALGKCLVKLKNWKNKVNIQCRNGSFNIKRKPLPKPVEKPPEVIPPTPEEKIKLRQQFEKMVKNMTPKIYINKGLRLTKAKRQAESLKSH